MNADTSPLRHLTHLTLRHVAVRSLTLGEQDTWEDGRLLVSRATVDGLFPQRPDMRLREVRAYAPGAATRLGPVLDTVDLRHCANGSAFPGVTGAPPQGEHVRLTLLDRVAVCVVSNLPGVQEGIIDMQSPYSPFGELFLLACAVDVQPDADREDADRAIRLFQCRLAETLAGLASDAPAAEELLQWPAAPTAPHLPRAGAVYFVQSQGALRRTLFHGEYADPLSPGCVNPLELLAGALVSGNYVMPSNKSCTYIHHAAPVLSSLQAGHGRDWQFTATILVNERSDMTAKRETAATVARIAQEQGLQALLINQEGGGNADIDIMLTCHELEIRGIKTVLLLNEFAGADGRNPSLTECAPEARYMVSTGNNDYLATLQPVTDFLGFPLQILGSQDPKGPLQLPLTRLYASTNQLGFGKLSCVTR